MDVKSSLSVKVDKEIFPTRIELKKPIIFSDTLGIWFRLEDGFYYSPLAKDICFIYESFKENLENGTAKVLSYKPNSEELIKAMFPYGVGNF